MNKHEAIAVHDHCTCDACTIEGNRQAHMARKYDGKIWCTCKPGTRCNVDCLLEDEDFIAEYHDLKNDALGG